MSKRVAGQYHLTLHAQPTYREIPLLNCKDGFVREYLEQLHLTINRSLERYSRVFAVRVDLHFPQVYHFSGEGVLSNKYVRSFIKTLSHRLLRYKKEKQLAGYRIHDVDFEYVWAREHGPSSNKPHFHILLLFNGHAFNSLGHFSNDHESLYNRIGESWGAALGIHVAEGSKLIHFPEIGQYLMDTKNPEGVAKVFTRASYLAKVASKNFHDGFHVFGRSRF